MGLLLGCSVMTLAEFIDIIFITIYKKNKVKAQKTTMADLDTANQPKQNTNQSIAIDDAF